MLARKKGAPLERRAAAARIASTLLNRFYGAAAWALETGMKPSR